MHDSPCSWCLILQSDLWVLFPSFSTYTFCKVARTCSIICIVAQSRHGGNGKKGEARRMMGQSMAKTLYSWSLDR